MIDNKTVAGYILVCIIVLAGEILTAIIKLKPMTPKEYKNKMMVKVVGSTYGANSEEKKAFIGKILEVKVLSYYENQVLLWTEDKRDWFMFNLSDVQIATPVIYEGINVCVGDKVKYTDWEEVLDYAFFDGEWVLIVGTFEYTYNCILKEIQALDPLYK